MVLWLDRFMDRFRDRITGEEFESVRIAACAAHNYLEERKKPTE